MPWWIKIRKFPNKVVRVYTLRPATLYFMYSLHSVWSTWMKSCFAKCLLWRLFEPITGSIFQDNKVTVSVPVTERERERDSGGPGGQWARAIPPSLVWTSVMRPLHYNYTFTLHLHIYIKPHDIMQCQLQKFNLIWPPPDKTCISNFTHQNPQKLVSWRFSN